MLSVRRLFLNTDVLLQRLVDTRVFESLLKPPSKELGGSSPLWKLKLFLLKQFCQSTDDLLDIMPASEFVKKLLKLGKKMAKEVEETMETTTTNLDVAKTSLEACAACSLCLWSLASSGAHVFGEDDEMIFEEDDAFGSSHENGTMNENGTVEELAGSELLRMMLNVSKYDERTTYTTLGALSYAVEQDPTIIDANLLDLLNNIQTTTPRTKEQMSWVMLRCCVLSRQRSQVR